LRMGHYRRGLLSDGFLQCARARHLDARGVAAGIEPCRGTPDYCPGIASCAGFGVVFVRARDNSSEIEPNARPASATPPEEGRLAGRTRCIPDCCPGHVACGN